VMDFGIARAVSDAQATMTQTAQVIGTAQYLSPEQARGERVDARSDLYSTGCLLYELLTGRPPFLGDSPVAIAYQHVRENPVPPSRVDPEVPQWADAIVLRAMAKDPRDRYQSAAEMRADIQRALQGVPVAAPRTAAYGAATTQRVGPPAAAAGMATGAMAGYDYGRGDESYPPEDRERRWLPIVLWILGVLLVLGVVAAVAYAILGGGTSTPAVPQVDGQTLTQAEHAITQAGLKYKVVKQSSSTVPKNIVIRTSPANGNVVAAGSTVTIFASTGPKMVDVPNVRHKPVADAENLLRSKGFEVQEQTAANSTAPPNTVVRQDPSPGSSARFGSTVTIFVSPGGSLVPAVVGDNYQVALGKLGNAGFSNINVVTVSNPQLSNGTVVQQSPHAGRRVPAGTQITLTVVKNEPTPSPTPSPTPTPTATPTPTPTPS
jgi:beta-lactam-binding protein with PASTA domain